MDVAEVCCVLFRSSLSSVRFFLLKVVPWSFFRLWKETTRRLVLVFACVCLSVCLWKYCCRGPGSLLVSVWKSKGEVTLFFTVILTSTETCLAQFRELGQGQILQGRWVLEIERECRSKTRSFANFKLGCYVRICIDWEGQWIITND